MPSLSKTYIIIGASRGIGLEFTRQVLPSSPENFVIATYRSREGLNALSELSREYDGSAWTRMRSLQCDLSDETSIRGLCNSLPKIISSFEWEGGGPGIDTVILNAGAMLLWSYIKVSVNSLLQVYASIFDQKIDIEGIRV